MKPVIDAAHLTKSSFFGQLKPQAEVLGGTKNRNCSVAASVRFQRQLTAISEKQSYRIAEQCLLTNTAGVV